VDQGDLLKGEQREMKGGERERKKKKGGESD
jgi:hypothetical protein